MIKTKWACRLALIVCAYLLGGCVGGISGSGDGGSDSGGKAQLQLPNHDDGNTYQLKTLPKSLVAAIPDSLASTAQPIANDDIVSPFGKVGALVSSFTDSKVELGLLQLHIDTNWDAIVNLCQSTPENSTCNLASSNIENQYTKDMAAWEFTMRATVAQEKVGATDTLSTETIDELINIVEAKVGQALGIDNGTFKRFSEGAYEFEIVTTLDIGFDKAVYTIRWSDNKPKAFVSLARISGDSFNGTQLSVNVPENGIGFENSILITNVKNEYREEKQLNFRNASNDANLQFETQLSEFKGPNRQDVYSLGQATDEGGFLRSSIVTQNAKNEITTLFQRETFNRNAQLDSAATCNPATSLEYCDANEAWEVIFGENPELSKFFLTTEQLIQLQAQLTPFELKFQSVSPEAEVLLLLRRENLTVTFSEEGIVLSLPGLGTLVIPANDTPFSELNLDQGMDLNKLPNLADSVLCRVNVYTQNGNKLYHSFCAGSVEEIENALVISEWFKDGKLTVQWEANTTVSVKQMRFGI